MAVLIGILVGVIIGIIVMVLVGILLYELIAAYRNPFPLFHNRDKRLSEIYKDKTKNYKTRSILEDINYGIH